MGVLSRQDTYLVRERSNVVLLHVDEPRNDNETVLNV